MKKASKASSFVACLFSLPFAGVGAVMIYITFSTVFTYLNQQTWVKTPAKIQSLNLQSRRSKNSTTYLAEGSFSYTFKGKQYTSSTLSQYTRSDNIGSYHNNLYNKLSRYRSGQKEYYCYVNPRNPSEAVMDRNLRVEAIGFFGIFILAFGGFGFTFFFFSIKSYFDDKKEEQLAEFYPDEPWMAKKQWADGAIRSSSKNSMYIFGSIAIIWNLLSSPIYWVLPQEVHKGNNAALIALVYPIAGLVLIIITIYCFTKWRKFGESTFLMQTFPGVIGGKLQGTVETTVNIKPEDGFHLKLDNIKRITTGSGKSRKTYEKVLWTEEKIMAKELMDYDQSMSAIPISFNIPYAQVKQTDSDNDVFWRLQVKAKVPGVDYSTKFEIPVFKTSDSDPNFEPNPGEESFKDLEVTLDPATVLRQAKLKVEDSLHGNIIRFPVLRNIGSILFLFVFVVIWTAISIFLLKSKAPMLFKIIWPATDVLMIFILFKTLFTKTTVFLEEGLIRVKGGILGLTSNKELDTSEISNFKLGIGVQYGSRIYHKIYAQTHSGKNVVIAKDLQKVTAEQFIEFVKEKTGMENVETVNSSPFGGLR